MNVNDGTFDFVLGLVVGVLLMLVILFGMSLHIDRKHVNVLIKNNLMTVTNDYRGFPTYYYTTNYVR